MTVTAIRQVPRLESHDLHPRDTKAISLVMEETLPNIDDLVEACRRAIHSTLDFIPEVEREMLPVLDHYAKSARPTQEEIFELLASYCGAFFAKVVMQQFPDCELELDEDIREWRVHFDSPQISFNPAGVAAEVLLQDDAPGFAAHFDVPARFEKALAEALSKLGPVKVSDYYLFSVRLEVLEQILVALALFEKQEQEKKN